MMVDVVRNLEPLFALAAPPDGGSPWLSFVPFVLVLAIFYFVILLPMKRKQTKVQEFLGGLKVGDRVVTTGGIYGQVTRLGEQTVQLQIADKVRIEVAKASIGGDQGEGARVAPGKSGEGEQKICLEVNADCGLFIIFFRAGGVSRLAPRVRGEAR